MGFNLGGIFGGGALDILVPGILTTLGTQLQNKDANTTGADDEGGRILIALAPVVPALIHGDVKTKKKALTAARDALNGYLATLGE